MKIALSSRGSRGDVHPIIRLAAALKGRGHRTTLCVPPAFLDCARATADVTLQYAEDSHAVMQGFGAGIEAARTALRWFSRNIDEQFDLLLQATEGADLLVSSVNELAAASVAQHRGIPHYRVAYAPILPGDQPPPLQPFLHLPAVVNRGMWLGLNAAIRALFGRTLDQWRQRLGLPPTGELGHHLASSSHTLLAISPTLAPPPDRGWPFPHTYVNYCFDHAAAPLDPDIQAFISQGPPPVYVGLGSVAVRDADRFTELVVAAADQAGCRIILGRGWAGLGEKLKVSARRAPAVLLVGETNHAALFPRVAAVMHHGGSGTVHQVARAGVPQVALPQLADQYYWGDRLYRLGLGPSPMSPNRLTVGRLTRSLIALTRETCYQRRAHALHALVRQEDGVRSALEVLAPHRHTGAEGQRPEEREASRTSSFIPPTAEPRRGAVLMP